MFRYPQFFQDENITWNKTFYSNSDKTTPVDPTSVVFKIKSPSGVTSTPTVVDETGTGNYSASKVVNEYGIWSWRWVTSNPTVIDQGFIEVIERNVE